jgi:hypothetical protein
MSRTIKNIFSWRAYACHRLEKINNFEVKPAVGGNPVKPIKPISRKTDGHA